ncbi:glucose 1-dehydrogenase [Mycobacterium sp. 236(2023)]|uniref:SDR family NAD(P)-dependent oxidoreductase n=1 Tax=Mycobacterium sp. 236(2023) TaxID=3038163 RepID=UPI0024158158|nr:glucose 1-dehydrogenase [Mycobacterium sp. 236(2023)]MDG4667074.1 glucose 1-dehydrogenase [Mycobacterium sp. 236(2023)]
MGLLNDKTALVTGGTSGIGLATAQRLASEGAHVFITGRNQSSLDAAVASIGDRATGVRGDVSQPEDLDAVVDAIRDHGAGLDTLFANAGGGEFAALPDITADHLAATFGTNVFGTVYTVQKVLPVLNRGASVVLAGSVAAHQGTPSFGAYAASKAAIRSLGRTWAAELADRGIRVNTVAPGAIETPGLKELAPEGGQQELLDQLQSGVPLGRLGHPDEIASAVVYLASDLSSYVTGTELFVDGGVEQV